MTDTDYHYVVAPFIRKCETRHEAVGYIALLSRDYPVAFRIIPVEADSPAEEIVDTVNEKLDDIQYVAGETV